MRAFPHPTRTERTRKSRGLEKETLAERHTPTDRAPSRPRRTRRSQKTAPDGSPTQSAHPARFSPDDKFSKQRVACKKRFGLLPTQKPIPEL